MKLKEYIDKHRLSYTIVGKSIGVSTEAVRRYVRGERIPQPDVMPRIVNYTSGAVTPNDFYNLSNQTPP